MAHKIEKLNAALEDLNNRAGGIGLVARLSTSHDNRAAVLDRETVPGFDQDEKNMVGRDELVSDMVTDLINSSNKRETRPCVMAIVGMAGLGKTTLAKAIYHENEIGSHFNRKIWVCVSNPFDVKAILSGILEYLNQTKAGVKGKAAICESIQEILEGNRYLLILDDVWNEDPHKWEELMSCLLNIKDTQGSSILVTTRSVRVASIVQTLPMRDLRKLSADECWLILKNKALSGRNATLSEDQERIGRDIAIKCAGLPLLAKILGSMMHKRSEYEWQSIQNNTILDIPEEEERLKGVLMLSFDELKSSSLKQCFAFCSMFIKGFTIEKDDLIQLWMAQELLYPSPTESMEDVGNKIFKILLDNSLFQDVAVPEDVFRYSINTKSTTFKMHDLVHDLAEFVSKSKIQDSNEIRRVPQFSEIKLEGISKGAAHKVRSMFLIREVCGNILPRFKGMRVLKLQGAEIDELPNSIGELKHLRYLDISATNIKSLPQSIGKLYNLQTLRMHHLCLICFPKELQNLINLRHVSFDPLYAYSDMKYPVGMGSLYVYSGMKYPVGMGRLNNLRSLSFFIVGKERGRKIKELGGLKHLEGQLSIYDLEHVRDGEEAKEAKLAEKTNIRRLRLGWNYQREGINNDRDVLEGLKPHSALEILEIRNFSGDTFPPWMMCGDLFSSLKRLTIENAKNLTEWRTEEAAVFPTTEGRVVFSRLEEMVLRDCPILECIPITLSLASLRELEISYCYKLSILPEGLERCTSLQVLGITGCSKITSIPITHGLPSLRKLDIVNCDELSSLPSGLQHCTSLKHLSIRHCGNLKAIPSLDSLTQLHLLEIYDCVGLKGVPPSEFPASLTRLKILKIGGFWKEFDSFPAFHVIPQLETLTLWGWPKLNSLPEQVQRFTSLTSLSISSFDGMKALPNWLGNLASLGYLNIGGCKNLMHLPTLEAMKCLTKLQDIWINNCPLLKERCNKDSGPEWLKISHIQHIYFDGVKWS
ncbi:hypothetical protein ACE6H2_021379 [Prunus campanulata]